MATLPSPVAQWNESPTSGAAVTLDRMYLNYDAGADQWTLTTDALQESGRFADTTGTSKYDLTVLASIPTLTPSLALTRRAGADIIAY